MSQITASLYALKQKLLGLALVCDTGDSSLDGFFICEIIVLDRLHVVIQFVNEGDASGDVQTNNLVVFDIVKIFDNRPKTVAMSRDENTLAGLKENSY